MASVLAAWNQLDDARHRAELYRLWLLTVSAGFTVPAAMDTLGVRQGTSAEHARRRLLDGTLRGRSVQEIVRSDGAPFSQFEVALLTIGDEAGQLETSIRLLAEFFEKKQRTMLVVRKRLAYPMFTAICATVIAPVPMLLTGHVGVYVATVLVACAVWLTLGGTIITQAAERFGRRPQLVRARLARALATAIRAGLPLGRAIPLAANASGDERLQRYIAGISERRLASESLTSTFANCPLMTPEFLAVLGNAERTGDFAGTLLRLADLYEDGFR